MKNMHFSVTLQIDPYLATFMTSAIKDVKCRWHAFKVI